MSDPKFDLRAEERLMWLCFVGLLTIITLATVWRLRPYPAEEVDLKPVLEKLQALEERAAIAESRRCMSIQTGKLDISVYPVENLGTQKVRKP